jgi:N-acetylglucosamine-6-phosphate deacetylase
MKRPITQAKSSIEANVAGAGPVRIAIEDGTIAAIERLSGDKKGRPYCSPGFVDIQVNGFAGVDFSAPDLDVEQIASIVPPLWSTGVTSFCPTLITSSLDLLEHNFRQLERARQALPRFAASVPCYHLEGPYISPGPSRGAHDPAWMRHPDWPEFERLQNAAGGRIGIITLAPELPGALAFIRRAANAGVRVAVSHTDCEPEDIHAAVAAGATLSTHLGNGCPQWIDRHRTPLWAQLASDELFASIICDGFHLPPDLVKTVCRMKGPERRLLVTDAVHVAGLAPGRYTLAGTAIEFLPSGQVVRADGNSMAGSALGMDRAVSNFMRLGGVSLEEALYAASMAPAKFLGSPSCCTRLAAGEPANLVVFRAASGVLKIEQTVLCGELVHELSN